jgi:hypothetical protein
VQKEEDRVNQVVGRFEIWDNEIVETTVGADWKAWKSLEVSGRARGMVPLPMRIGSGTTPAPIMRWATPPNSGHQYPWLEQM